MLDKIQTVYDSFKISYVSKFQIILILILGIFIPILDILGFGTFIYFIISNIFVDFQTNSKLYSLLSSLGNFFKENFNLDLITFILILFILRFIILILVNFFLANLRYSIINNVRNSLFKNYLGMSLDYFLTIDKAKAIINVINNTNSTAKIIFSSTYLISDSINIIIYVLFLVLFSNISNYINEFFIIFLFIGLLTFTLSKFFHNFGLHQIIAYAKITNLVNNVFDGLKEIKFLLRDKFFIDQFKRQSQVFKKNATLNEACKSSIKPSIEILFICATIVIIYIKNILDNSNANTNIDTSTLLIFLFSLVRIAPLINGIMNKFTEVMFNIPGSKEVISFLRDKKTVNSNKFNYELKKANYTEFNNLHFENISFFYPRQTIAIFEDLNFVIKKNNLNVIMGKSGSGKSTLVNIILGLLKLNSGKKYMENSSYNLENFKNLTTYISQDNFIFNDTLLANITMENNKRYISHLESKELLKIKNLFKELAFPLNEENINLDYKIEENGKNLSGGQKQKISLIRSLYNNKKILFLDEITSSLDEKNELEVFSILKEMSKQNTIILVTHSQNIKKFETNILNLESER